MPKRNRLKTDPCGCRLDGPIFLYVGKAVKLKNRLQSYGFTRRFGWKPPGWTYEFQDKPHEHLLQVAIWYVERPLIAVAEGTLISALRPLKNVRDRQGFGDLWPIREPDLFATLEDVEPRSKEPDRIRVEDRPGVYAWYVDPGEQLYGHGKMADAFKPLPTHWPDLRTLKKAIVKCEEIKRSCRRRRATRIPFTLEKFYAHVEETAP